MSLKLFHLVFILCSIGLSFFLGAWCFESYSDTDSVGTLVLGLASVASGLGMTFYLTWFLKKLRDVSFFVFLAAMLVSQPAFSCPVCIGDPNHPMVQSANSAVLFLLVVVGAVLSAFASILIVWSRRAKRVEGTHEMHVNASRLGISHC